MIHAVPKQSPHGLAEVITGWTLLSMVVMAVVHIAFAIGVHAHARGRKTTFVAPWAWTLATLFGGPFVALAYWTMHVSRLAPTREHSTEPERRSASRARRTGHGDAQA